VVARTSRARLGAGVRPTETDGLGVPYMMRYRGVASMIAPDDTDCGATVSGVRSVTGRISQGSRHGPGGSSNVIHEGS